MTNLARFTIQGTPSSQGYYDVTPEQVLNLALESSSSLVYRVTYAVHSAASGAPRKTRGAPSLTLTAGGVTAAAVEAARPAWAATVQGFPAVIAPHLWEIRCTVNGGTNQDGSVNPDFVFSRYVAMRSGLNLRKLLPTERGEYDPSEYWASAINEIIDALGGSLGSKSWHTLADIAFADEPDQTIDADGDFVVDGVTFHLRHVDKFRATGLRLSNINAGSGPYPGLRFGCTQTAGTTQYQSLAKTELPIVSIPFSQWPQVVREVPVRFSVQTGYSLIPSTGGNIMSVLAASFLANDTMPCHVGVQGYVPSAAGQYFSNYQAIWKQFGQSSEAVMKNVPNTIDCHGVVLPDGVSPSARWYTYHGTDCDFESMIRTSHLSVVQAEQLVDVADVEEPQLWGVEMFGAPNTLNDGAWLLWKRLLIQAYY